MIDSTDSNFNNSPQNVAITKILDSCEKQILRDIGKHNDSNGLIFTSAPYESLPSLIAKDPILRPVDKVIFFNIWIFAKENGQQQLSFPSYDYLSRTSNAARATISASIKKLRVYGLLTTARTIRDESGKYRGNIYIINAEPMSLNEILKHDTNFIRFLNEVIQHEETPDHLKELAQAKIESINDELEEGKSPFEPLTEDQKLNQLIEATNVINNPTSNESNGIYGFKRKHVKRISASGIQVQKLNSVKKRRTPPYHPSSETELGLEIKPTVQELNSVVSSSNNIKNTTTTYMDEFDKDKIIWGENVGKVSHDLIFTFMRQLSLDIQIPKDLSMAFNFKSINDYFQFLLDELEYAIKIKELTQYPILTATSYFVGMIKKIGSHEYSPNGGYTKAQQKREMDSRQRNNDSVRIDDTTAFIRQMVKMGQADKLKSSYTQEQIDKAMEC